MPEQAEMSDFSEHDLSHLGGGRLELDRAFKPVNIAVLSVSDTRTKDNDTSGDVLENRITSCGHKIMGRAIVRDDRLDIAQQINSWIDQGNIDVIITTGGTGITRRDITPEAVEPLLDKRIDGFSTVFHMVSFQTVGLSTLQSRAVAGISRGVFIFCLPGSNGAVKDGWDRVIRWQLDSRHAPCNMVELMGRLKEK